MSTKANFQQKIMDCVTPRRMVRFKTKFETHTIKCHVVGCGTEFFMALIVDDDQAYDGFQFFRHRDVTQIWDPMPYADFVKDALRLQKLKRPRTPKVDLQGIGSILSSISRLKFLVSIHMDVREPDICLIGTVASIDKKRFCILEIDPHANWHDELTHIRFSSVTRLGIGAKYEKNLEMVARWRAQKAKR